MRKLFVFMLAAAMAIALSAPASAAEKKGVEVIALSEVEITVVNEKGQKEIKRIEANKAKVVPGTEVIFTNICVNNGPEAANDIVLENPIPRNMIYKYGTAEGKDSDITFSIDGGKEFNTPENLFIKREGKLVPATVSDYTHIRWVLKKSLPAKAKATFAFRAIVE